MKERKWTREQLTEAAKNNFSIAGVIKTLGLVPSGANYKLINKKSLSNLGIDISHFTGQGHLKGKTNIWSLRQPIEQILVTDSSYTNINCLKRRLIKVGFLKPECNICKIVSWLGQPLSLHLDHINGVNNDHRLENLRLLCPNCHSQTPTYAGKNKAKRVKVPKLIHTKKMLVEKLCPDCGKQIYKRKSIRCKSCAGKHLNPSKISWPSKEDLERMVWSNSTVVLSKKLGVSDTAIAKHCKQLGISKPPRGYWAKMHAKSAS